MFCIFFFFKQKTAYEMRISDWSSDVCSSDLPTVVVLCLGRRPQAHEATRLRSRRIHAMDGHLLLGAARRRSALGPFRESLVGRLIGAKLIYRQARSEEHTSELQSLMRISYAVFCLKKKNKSCIQL